MTYLGNIVQGMLKRGGSPSLSSKKLRRDFDGKPQVVRGNFIPHPEEIEDFANELLLAVRGEKNEQKCAYK
jgi:hypothetical protein